jgi:large subunit ribosomal protein L15
MDDLILKAPAGANRNKKRIGRGPGSGTGKTAGKGHKGQNARSGGGVRPGFEGGQMPLYRRIASRGFSNYPFKKVFKVINVAEIDEKYIDGETVSLETLKDKKIIKKSDKLVKLLGNGEITKKLEVTLDKVSVSAKEKIEKAGGKIVTVEKKESRE